MNLKQKLSAVALTGALTFGGVAAASPAAAHTGHHILPIGSRHWVSLYNYEQPISIVQVNYAAPFCWGASSWIKTVDSRTGREVKSRFKRCW